MATISTTLLPSTNGGLGRAGVFFRSERVRATPLNSSVPRRSAGVAQITSPFPLETCRIQAGWNGFGRRTLGLHVPRAMVYRGYRGSFDPDLRLVLELATEEELYELQGILFGASYFSPLLKSITRRPDFDYILDRGDRDGRESFIEHLESRFFFLAADARSTLRGWRPSYRDVLLGVRRKLGVPCSGRLATEDLEVEIFLHLLDEYASLNNAATSGGQNSLEIGLSKWKFDVLAAVKVGAKEFQQMFLKGGGVLTVAKLSQWVARRLSGKVLVEAANYQIKNEIFKRGGHFAALSLESRTALLAARQGFARAASRYLGFRSVMMLLGPVLWGTLLADVVIQMLGTDYARVLRAIYAFAQIRLTRTNGWTSNVNA